MTTPTHLLPCVRDLGRLPDEGLPLRGETEHQYFTRLAAEFRRNEQSERWRQMRAWLLGYERPENRRSEREQPARSGRSLG